MEAKSHIDFLPKNLNFKKIMNFMGFLGFLLKISIPHALT